MQSAFDYFVAKYLGYDVRMYDSSFFEWSNEDLPAEKSKFQLTPYFVILSGGRKPEVEGPCL